MLPEARKPTATDLPLSALIACFLCTEPISARASNTLYALASSDGTLEVDIPTDINCVFCNNTATAEAGLQTGGTFGAQNVASSAPHSAPTWLGSFPNGTALVPQAGLGAGPTAPTISSIAYYPLGWWAAGQRGGTITIPTAGYINLPKTTPSAYIILKNTVGNTNMTGNATWKYTPGALRNNWSGSELAIVKKDDPTGAAIMPNSRAVAYISDPQFFYLSSDDEPLSFQVILSDLLITLTGTAVGADMGDFADAYYEWSVTFGSGDVAGVNTIYSASGGQDYDSPGVYTPNPGTVVDYSNDTLSAGEYWLIADLNVGAEVVPEPAGFAILGASLAALSVLRRKRRAAPHPMRD